MLNRENKFINTSIEYFEELEAISKLKTKGWHIGESISALLNELQDILKTDKRDIPIDDILKKLKKIENLICDFSQSTKREYFKLGLEMKTLIESMEEK